jgi:hypothetical protein
MTSDFYRQIDDDINQLLGVDVGFTARLRAESYPMTDEEVAAYRQRHTLIRQFQEITLVLFQASLRGEADPAIAASVLGDVPPHLGREYHAQLTGRQHLPPIFFRTDEPVPGKLSEIQCPGSGWCLAEEILSLYQKNPSAFGHGKHFSDSLAATFAASLAQFIGRQPLVHHLVDNASRPHGMRYFIQRTRQHGVRYFSYDHGVGPGDCNFIRSHDFITLPHHNFFADRMQRCERGELRFDLPPSVLFDGKIIFAWPFWSLTRQVYPDQIRGLFPYANMLTPAGFQMPDGQRTSLEELKRTVRQQGDYYIKYAGSDIALNWGSKSVYLLGSLSRPQLQTLQETIANDFRRGRLWIAQEALEHRENVPAITRKGGLETISARSKFSGFYGPSGLMGILVMQNAFHKVHGGENTVMSVVR